MNKTKSLIRFTIQFIIGVIVGIAGFAFTIMLKVKMPFLIKLYSSNWEVLWSFSFIIIGLLGFGIVEKAGWSKITHRELGGVRLMDAKLIKEKKKILHQWLSDAKEQKRTIENWYSAEGKKLKELEDFIGQPIQPIRDVMEMYKQSLPKLDDEIKRLEEDLRTTEQ